MNNSRLRSNAEIVPKGSLWENPSIESYPPAHPTISIYCRCWQGKILGIGGLVRRQAMRALRKRLIEEPANMSRFLRHVLGGSIARVLPKGSLRDDSEKLFPLSKIMKGGIPYSGTLLLFPKGFLWNSGNRERRSSSIKSLSSKLSHYYPIAPAYTPINCIISSHPFVFIESHSIDTFSDRNDFSRNLTAYLPYPMKITSR